MSNSSLFYGFKPSLEVHIEQDLASRQQHSLDCFCLCVKDRIMTYRHVSFYLRFLSCSPQNMGYLSLCSYSIALFYQFFHVTYLLFVYMKDIYASGLQYFQFSGIYLLCMYLFLLVVLAFSIYNCLFFFFFCTARVITDRDSGRSRGFGFVNYSSDESANKALSAMDGQVRSRNPYIFFSFFFMAFNYIFLQFFPHLSCSNWTGGTSV